MASLREKGIALLVSASGIDINNGSKQTIYSIPTGKSCIVTEVVVRNLSGACASNSISFGFNANANDVIANAVHAGFTASTVYNVLVAMVGATVGLSGEVFGVKCNTTDSAATATIMVYGYLF